MLSVGVLFNASHIQPPVVAGMLATFLYCATMIGWITGLCAMAVYGGTQVDFIYYMAPNIALAASGFAVAFWTMYHFSTDGQPTWATANKLSVQTSSRYEVHLLPWTCMTCTQLLLRGR